MTKEKNQVKDLGSIIDRLVRKEQTNRQVKLPDLYKQTNQTNVLQLEKVDNSPVAVYQTIKIDPTDDIKKEIEEVDELLLNRTAVSAEGKAIPMKQITETSENNQCKICKYSSSPFCVFVGILISYFLITGHIYFSTVKTLKLHIKAKHIPSTYVYPCPSCNLTFMQPSAVFRHLSNDHK